MTEQDCTLDSTDVFIELFDSFHALQELSSLTPIDDPNYLLLGMVTARMESALKGVLQGKLISPGGRGGDRVL